MPVSKAQISRDQLSQLLLVYLGIAADIIELFAIFDEPSILKHRMFILIVLAFWSWSVMQFTLVLTATRSRGWSADNKIKPNEPYVCNEPGTDSDDGSGKDFSGIHCCFFCDGEIFSIIIMCLMLDLPFLALRLTAMIHYKINTYTIYFFTCKNVTVILLLAYRLLVVCAMKYNERHGEPDITGQPYTAQRSGSIDADKQK